MNTIQKVWIIGADGKLGRAIKKLIDIREVEVLSTDKDDVDITDTQEVLRFADMNRPDVMINCAGMTSIEACEVNKEMAYQVNAIGARNVSIAANKIGARLIHLSTDDVFDGKKHTPYTEFEPTSPLSVYGQSKLAGEQFIKDFNNKYMIIRSSWIYGEGDNLVNDIVKAYKEKKTITVSKEIWGSPTSAKELAKLVIHLMNTSDYGLYHAVCEGGCSHYELAQEVVCLLGNKNRVGIKDVEDMKELKICPTYTVLDNFMLRMAEHYQMPHWKDALKEYIESLK